MVRATPLRRSYYLRFTIYDSRFTIYDSRENFNNLFNCPRQHVHFFLRIIKSKRRPRGGWNIKPMHDGLRAVMPGAKINTFLIEDGANVMRVNILNHE